MTWDGGDESRVQALMAENERLREENARLRILSNPAHAPSPAAGMPRPRRDDAVDEMTQSSPMGSEMGGRDAP